MKKIIIILLFILFCIPKSFGQIETVTISTLIVNNVSVNSNVPVNINPLAVTTISLSTEVKFPSAPDNGGTITIYYQKNKTSPIITANGGYGGNLLFNGGTSATRSFTITLDPAQFDSSGGYFYSEYKTSIGVAYKSTNIPIVKTIPDTNPVPPSDPNYASQTVPYGGTPLLPDFTNYYNMASQNWVDFTNNIILTSRNGGKLYESTTIRQQTIFNNGTIKYESQKMNITVAKFLPDYSRLYINNQISDNMYIPVGQNAGTIIGNQATENHFGSGTQNNLNNYQWQSRIIYPFWWSNFSYGLALYGWKDIPEATQQNYTPSAPTRGMEYRRLVLEKVNDNSIDRHCAASNVITIYPIDNTITENTICCDQTVSYSETPNSIIGSSINGSIIYKWQNSSDSGVYWSDGISNKKNYTPVRPTTSRGQPYVGTIKYRRLALDYNTNLYTLSNETALVYSNTSKKASNGKEQLITASNSIITYPNPSSSIITIGSINNPSSYQIKVLDTTGKTVLSKKANQSNNELLQVDISTLANGIYILELANEVNKFSKKIIKN